MSVSFRTVHGDFGCEDHIHEDVEAGGTGMIARKGRR